MATLDQEGWNLRYADRPWPPEPREPWPPVVELVSPLATGRVLDLAAGEGRNAIWLAKRGWRVTAVDISNVALDRARHLADQAGVEMDYVVADVCDYVPEREAFELVLIAYVHPWPQCRDALFAGAADAVSSGGHLLVLGLDLAGRRPGGQPDFERCFTPDRLAGAFPGIELMRLETIVGDDGGEYHSTLAWGTRHPS